MDAASVARKQEEERLLARLAELMIEEQRALGTFDRTPHFSELEESSLSLGQRLTRVALKRAACEVAAAAEEEGACPTCGEVCRLTMESRTLQGIAGPVEILEPVGHCPACRRDFFPQREALGLDSRRCTPMMTRMAIHVAAETRSYERASVLIEHTLGHTLSAKTVERLVHQVGGELAQRREQEHASLVGKAVVVPEVAVVSCDGGRIHTRAVGQGPGVHEARWRESKNALFERKKALPVSDRDPCPLLPGTFRQVAHVAQIAEKAAFDVECPASSRPRYKSCRRILRTCLSSLASSGEFGLPMSRESRRRRFGEASRRVFLGDGLPWNWSIWKEHFADFTPILDLIHAVQHLYTAAQAWESSDAARWGRYLEMAEAVWQGRVGEVIASLHEALFEKGVGAGDKLADDHPLAALAETARSLENNRQRMDYPRYRREGLPITSASMESLIKQINHRVKGTEMFWNDPEGAEAILQIRAAALSEDGRLDDHLRRRPGWPFTRRPSLHAAA